MPSECGFKPIVTAIAAAAAVTLIWVPSGQPAWVAEAQSVVELVGQLGGEVGGVEVAGPHAYVALGARVAVLSISGDSDLALEGMSDLLPAPVADLVWTHGVLVVALGEAGVGVLEVDPSGQPRLAGRLQTDAAYHLEAANDLVLVFSGDAVLSLDVTGPTNPLVVGTLEPFTQVLGGRFTLLTGNDLIVASSTSLIVVDAADARHLRVAHWDESREVWGIAASERAVFASIQTIDVPKRGDCHMVVHALDRSPENLLGELGQIGLPSCDPMQAMIVHGAALIVRYRAGLQLIDVQDPSNPRLGPYVELPPDGIMSNMTRPSQMALVADRLFLTTNSTGEGGPEPLPAGVLVIDLGPGMEAALRGSWLLDEPGSVSQAATAGGHLILSGGLGDAVRVYDVIDQTHPRLLSSFVLDSVPVDTAADSSWIVTADEYGVHVVDIADPRQPAARGSWSSPNNVTEVAIDGLTVYAGVAHSSESGPEWREVVVFRLLLDGGLELQRRADVCKSPISEMTPVGDILYVLCRDEGLVLVDIKDRFAPVVRASIVAGANSMALAVADGVAMIATRETTPPAERDVTPRPRYGGLRLFAAADPDHLRAMGVFTTVLALAGSSQQWSIVPAGDYALMAASERSLRVVEVRDPDRPYEAQVVPAPTSLGALARLGQYVYAAGHEGGLYVFRLKDASPPVRRGLAYVPLAVSPHRGRG